MSEALTLKPSYYEALRRLTLELAGIKLGSDHRFLIETRLRTLARQEGYRGLEHMVEELFSEGQARLALQVVSSLLERDTHFNSDTESLSHLTTHILPALSNVYGQTKIRILSFGCSSGQETWSLAMQMDKNSRAFPDLDYEIIGVDYPSPALERARKGQYTHFEVQRGLAVRDLITYFSKHGEDWRLNENIRERVSFQEHHLMSNLVALGEFHLVMFRNRLPAYASAAQVRLIRGLSSIVRPMGFLMLGSKEKAPKISYGFDPVDNRSGVYLKRPPSMPMDDIDSPESEEFQVQRLTMLEKAMLEQKNNQAADALSYRR